MTFALYTLYQYANATPIPVDQRNTRAAQISTGTFALIYAMMLNDARKTAHNYNGYNWPMTRKRPTWKLFTDVFIPLSIISIIGALTDIISNMITSSSPDGSEIIT